MRIGHYRPVHVKLAEGQLVRTTLQARRQIVARLLQGTIRGLLRMDGLKVARYIGTSSTTVNLWTAGYAGARVTAQARSPTDEPGKTPLVSATLPTGRRLPTSFFLSSPQQRGLILTPGKVKPSTGDQPYLFFREPVQTTGITASHHPPRSRREMAGWPARKSRSTLNWPIFRCRSSMTFCASSAVGALLPRANNSYMSPRQWTARVFSPHNAAIATRLELRAVLLPLTPTSPASLDRSALSLSCSLSCCPENRSRRSLEHPEERPPEGPDAQHPWVISYVSSATALPTATSPRSILPRWSRNWISGTR
jgi:hypothetical protein